MKDPVYIAGVFSQDPALEHERIGFRGCVADFSITHQTLIGIQFQQCAALRGTVNIAETHIGNAQRRRVNCSVIHYERLPFLLPEL